MPTIEIASVNSSELNLDQEALSIAVIEENKLESHRGLFYDFLSKQQGVIVHVGNPEMKARGDLGFFAGEIVNWDFESDSNFQFKREYVGDLKTIIQRAFEKSPNQKTYFLTDYQFGPDISSFNSIGSLSKFWKQHENEGLTWNTLYEINRK